MGANDIIYDMDILYIAITPILSIEEPVDSLIMEDEHLDTISATESDEIVIDFNDDSTSSDDDSPYGEDIDYVDASPPDSELVSLEVVENVTPEDGEIEDDSPFTFPNLFLEETNTFDNFLPESKTFCFDLEENSSCSTTTRSDYSFPDYEVFYLDDDYVEENSSGSTTPHADFSQYDSFIFDLSINSCPPADRSDCYHEKFASELAHIISPLEYDCFYFKSEPDPGELTSIVDSGIRKNVLSTTNVNVTFEDDQSPLLAYVVWIFLNFLTYRILRKGQNKNINGQSRTRERKKVKSRGQSLQLSRKTQDKSLKPQIHQNRQRNNASVGEIEDDVLREKLSKINLLIAKIEALKDNPPLSSGFVTKSPSTFPNLFLEETNTFDNSLPESETFCFDLEENSSGSTTTRSDYSFPDYEVFYLDDDYVEEKSSGSTTTHADFSQYDSFIFYLSINSCPPADRSDCYHEKFAGELAHIISPPEYDCFYFKSEPDPGELTSIVDSGIRENVLSTTNVNLTFEDDQSPLLAYVVWIFLNFLTYPVTPPYLLSTGSEDTIFDPDISI
ncbi:hypothetical protein Tco_0369924 [Tanacetum coccineum]